MRNLKARDWLSIVIMLWLAVMVLKQRQGRRQAEKDFEKCKADLFEMYEILQQVNGG